MKAEVSKERVIIEPIEETVTASGIIIQDVKSEYPAKGRVVRVYEGERDYRFVNVGDLVLYNKVNTVKLYLDGKEYLMTREVDVYVKLNEEN